MSRNLVGKAWGLLFAAVVATVLPTAVAAQTGQVTGRVTHAQSGDPLSAVQLSIQGTTLGALSAADGAFTIQNVPVGTHVLIMQRLGYQASRREGVVVTAGPPQALTLTMAPAVLALQGIVATGLVDPVEGVRAPIAVARVTREMMPTTVAGSAVQNLQGRVAGLRMNRSSGQPGQDMQIVLRTPTSLRGNTFPLIVVDGVILGGSGDSGDGIPSTADLDAMDIESIEVIRGAAASSLYGSRANAGVIAITTTRGQGLTIGQTRFTARTEIGISQDASGLELNDSHPYFMNAAGTAYVDAAGSTVEVPRVQRKRPVDDFSIMDQAYPVPIYNNMAAATRAGSFRSSNFQVSGNSATTNFAVSLNNYVERGTLINNEGYERNAFRINLDHRFRDDLSLGVSMYHSRDWRDETANNAFNNIQGAPRDLDLSITDPATGEYLQQPDPVIAYQNPLWTEANRENTRKGTRTLGNLNLNWSPLSWLSTSGSVGYDRDDSETREYTPKGIPVDVGSTGTEDGSISFDSNVRDTWNAEGQVSFRRDIGSLNVRTTFRGVLERSEAFAGLREGENFILVGIPQIDNTAAVDRNAESSQREIRALGYLWDTAFDYDGKYILTVLGRRDGSSLFGSGNRWHTYYRLAGAWRLAEEPWFNVPNVSEFKLSVARGTAGGRPSPTQQYETWTLTNGIPTKGNLGNLLLAPEHTTEHEFSLNMVLFERFGVVLTHARQTTEDLLNPAPLPAITGYGSQWVNAGSVSGHSTELELEMQMIQSANVGWTSMIVADYSNARITEWTIPCYTQAWLFNCIDIPVYGIYSFWVVKSRAGLNQHNNGALLDYADEFEVNDEGFLVWVGEGNHYWQGWGADGERGTADDLWGTSTQIGRETFKWGHPFNELQEEGNDHRTLLGEGTAANFGWLNNLRIGQLTLNSQLHLAIGGDANNRRHQILARAATLTSPHLDQAGKPEELKKPIGYYRSAEDGDTSYATQDASYLKLREVSANYSFNANTLGRIGLSRAGVQELSLGLIVRNVFTYTNYEGYDPEQGLNLNSRASSDGGSYPPTRQFTAEVSVTF